MTMTDDAAHLPPDITLDDPADDDPEHDDDEVLTGELVPVEPAGGRAAAHAAIEAAAVAALESPGIPGRDEFLSLAMQARMMAGSSLVPSSLRGKPADVFLVLLTGRDVGIPVTSALRKVYVVDGQPSLAPQLKLALVRRHGLGTVVPHPDGTDEWQGAVAIGPDGTPLGPPIVVTWDDAAMAGLVLSECRPTNHSEQCNENQGKRDARVKCKANWRSYPRRMLWWRAAGYCVDDYFPEVGLGLYTPDELGAVTDTDGRPIDPSTVSLPEGFEDAERRTGGTAAQQAAQREQGATAPADVLADLQLRARLLPDEVQSKLRDQWKASERVQAYTLATLPNGLVTYVDSMIRGFERIAVRDHGWDPDAARAAHDQQVSTDTPPEGPETASEPSGDVSPADAAGDATGPESGDVTFCGECGDAVRLVDTVDVDGETWCVGCAEIHAEADEVDRLDRQNTRELAEAGFEHEDEPG